MAGDRHGKHNTTTISFRVNSYEKATIEERVKVSGMKKQDYIVRSCIYNHVCVVGKKKTIEIIRSEMRDRTISCIFGSSIMDAERFKLFMGG